MSDRISFENLLEGIAEPETRQVSSRLKSRIYSKLVLAQAESGPLRSLTEVKADGRRLCVFEELVQISPLAEPVKAKNPCRVCHARLLGENVEGAPIYWPHCPYVLFQNR